MSNDLSEPIPEYSGLRMCGIILCIVGWMQVAACNVLAVVALVLSRSDYENLGAMLAGTVGGMIVGIVLIGLGTACDALRDIARNSFKRQ